MPLVAQLAAAGDPAVPALEVGSLTWLGADGAIGSCDAYPAGKGEPPFWQILRAASPSEVKNVVTLLSPFW